MKKIALLLSLLLAPALRADERPTLEVYTYELFSADWGPGPELKANFEKHCGCTVRYTALDNVLLLANRLKADGSALAADVVIGLDQSQIDDPALQALFAPTKIDRHRIQVPLANDNPLFIPYDFAALAFVYRRDALKTPPTSLAELLQREDVAVIYPDPRSSIVGRGFVQWLQGLYADDKADAAWSELARHTLTVGKGWSDSYGAFLKGEGDMVLSYNTSPLYHQMNDKTDNYAAAEFGEGSFFQVETMAKTAHANRSPAQSQLAEDFLSYLLSDEAQALIATKNVMLSATGAPVGSGYDELRQRSLTRPVLNPKPPLDSKAAIKRWQRAAGR